MPLIELPVPLNVLLMPLIELPMSMNVLLTPLIELPMPLNVLSTSLIELLMPMFALLLPNITRLTRFNGTKGGRNKFGTLERTSNFGT